jgi:hypothetical protein
LDFTLHDRFLKELPADGILIRRPWPWDLFIPGSADWTTYLPPIWFAPPPPDHRYNQSWLTPPSDNPNRADPNLGTAWAYSAVGVGTPVLDTQAAIGFPFTPPETGTYIVAPTLSVMGQFHVDIETTAAAYGSIFMTGGVFTAVWDQATLTLQQPFRYAELFNHESDGQETIQNSFPATWDGRGAPTALSIGLVSGIPVLIGVAANVKISNTWTDLEGNPIQTLPDGSKWTVYCTMEFLQMPQVWIGIA